MVTVILGATSRDGKIVDLNVGVVQHDYPIDTKTNVTPVLKRLNNKGHCQQTVNSVGFDETYLEDEYLKQRRQKK